MDGRDYNYPQGPPEENKEKKKEKKSAIETFRGYILSMPYMSWRRTEVNQIDLEVQRREAEILERLRKLDEQTMKNSMERERGYMPFMPSMPTMPSMQWRRTEVSQIDSEVQRREAERLERLKKLEEKTMKNSMEREQRNREQDELYRRHEETRREREENFKKKVEEIEKERVMKQMEMDRELENRIKQLSDITAQKRLSH